MSPRRKSAQIPEEDAEALRAEVRRLSASSVLEFGPGESTEVFRRAGVSRIVPAEYQERWLEAARERWAGDPAVEVILFANQAPRAVFSERMEEQFDLAFVDSPVGDARRKRLPGQEPCSRLNTTRLALRHAPVVLLHDADRPGERATLERLALEGWMITHLVRGSTSSRGKGVARIEW